MLRRIPLLVLAVLTGVTSAGLSGCAADVPMTAAEDANNPACADIIVRLPDTLAGLRKRNTNAQATGAWGDPVAVQLVCGEPLSGPTTDDCISVNDVDWIRNDSHAPIYRFEAYGRSPGLAVYIDSEQVSGSDAITQLSSLAKRLPQQRHCTALSDTY